MLLVRDVAREVASDEAVPAARRKRGHARVVTARAPEGNSFFEEQKGRGVLRAFWDTLLRGTI